MIEELKPLDPAAYRQERAHRCRKPGVKYTLRLIEGSGGQLELVEEKPRPSLFTEWARVMQFSGWTM